MKCPMAKWETENSHLVGFNNCIKAECAWWIDAKQQCAIKALAKELPRSVNNAIAVNGE
jgi:hypothetical protein